MLDKFKRPDDHPEYYRLYGIPRAVAMTLYGAGVMSGKFPAIDAAAATLSGLLCIGDIGGLASQSRTRLGAASGRAGVAFGAASILGYIHPKRGQTASIADLTAIITNLAAIIADLTAAGGAAETASATALAHLVAPDCRAAFHSSVSVAASAAVAVGDYTEQADDNALDKVHLSANYLATIIGSATTTGSLVAFGKLDRRLPLRHARGHYHPRLLSSAAR
eukprot:CAMPEP_0113569534 /NCGR_PEP_ID=MMETSP0015_2-20120614/24465_1 /TAXON_ID=2838 /ORGANISM="Odontella" /LENGTH=220 /DNA_ID=CAMNT_0000472211 /DNA_START=397 /DNA_END=1060 /DNA_ORIENTATION=- /assembly_acc=CAM_ASM_000160